MTATLIIIALAASTVALAVFVLYLRAQRHLDELEIEMLRHKLTELGRHPAVQARPKPELVRHRRHLAGVPIVTDPAVEPDTVEMRDGDTVVARATITEAAKHAAARERREG